MRTQEFEPGIELLKEATFKLAKVLGKEHPDTQMMMGRLNEAARDAGMRPGGGGGGGGGGGSASPASVPALAPAPVLAQVCGLVNAADLNQCSATVISWVEEQRRYQCRVRKHDGSFCSVGVKPGNLLLPAGTAVTVRGVTGVSWQHWLDTLASLFCLQSQSFALPTALHGPLPLRLQAPELNGKVGAIVGDFNAEKGRYSVQVEGRTKAAGLKPENVMLVLHCGHNDPIHDTV